MVQSSVAAHIVSAQLVLRVQVQNPKFYVASEGCLYWLYWPVLHTNCEVYWSVLLPVLGMYWAVLVFSLIECWAVLAF